MALPFSPGQGALYKRAESGQTQPDGPSLPADVKPLISVAVYHLWACEDTLAQEGSVTQLGSSVRPSGAGACLHFIFYSANLSPHLLSSCALRWLRLGCFLGHRVPRAQRDIFGAKALPAAVSEPPLWSVSFLGAGSQCSNSGWGGAAVLLMLLGWVAGGLGAPDLGAWG